MLLGTVVLLAADYDRGLRRHGRCYKCFCFLKLNDVQARDADRHSLGLNSVGLQRHSK